MRGAFIVDRFLIALILLLRRFRALQCDIDQATKFFIDLGIDLIFGIGIKRVAIVEARLQAATGVEQIEPERGSLIKIARWMILDKLGHARELALRGLIIHIVERVKTV